MGTFKQVQRTVGVLQDCMQAGVRRVMGTFNPCLKCKKSRHVQGCVQAGT